MCQVLTSGHLQTDNRSGIKEIADKAGMWYVGQIKFSLHLVCASFERMIARWAIGRSTVEKITFGYFTFCSCQLVLQVCFISVFGTFRCMVFRSHPTKCGS